MRALSILLASLLLAATSATASAPLEPGSPLPTVIGERLDGLEIELPAAVRGRVTLVAFGFTRGSAKAVQAYGDRFRQAFAADSTYDWLEVPLMGGMARVAKPWITGAMRGATPVAERRHVATVWSGAGEWKRRLAYDQGGWAYLVLLDREGLVRWRGAGAFDERTWNALESAAKTAR